MKIQKRFLSLGIQAVTLTAFTLSCGSLLGSKKSSSSSSSAAPSTDSATAELQLKNASLLQQSVELSFGSGKDLMEDPSAPRNATETKVSCFKVYEPNLGSEAGLRYGEIFADSPSTQYFMSLSICASKIAKSCQEEIRDKKPNSKCDCSTPDKAKRMLQISMPQIDFSLPENAVALSKVTDGCKTDYTGTIASIVSSLAFAQRR
jgi:hypothetical protein